MKYFTKFLLWFLILILLALLLSCFYKNVIMEDSAMTVIDKQFHKTENHLNYLIVGDSHFENAIDPRYLPHSFNFSHTSTSYFHTYYKLKYVFENNVKQVDTVVIPMDLHTFSTLYYKIPTSSWYWMRYVNFIDLGIKRNNVIYQVLDICRGVFAPYVFKKDFFLRKIDPKKETSVIISGFSPLPKNTKGISTEEVEESTSRHFKEQNLKDLVILDYFWKTLELCAKYHKKVVIIRCPVSNLYLDLSRQYVDTNSFYEIKKETQAKYPNIVFGDFLDLFVNEQNLFANSDHLNEEGAKEFSQFLSDFLATHNKELK